MSDPHVLVKIWHDGVLRWKPKVRYLGGESSVVQIEADKMSFFELKDYVLEKSSYKNKDFSMFYLKPGHKLDVGLVELENDADVNNMMVVLGDDIRHMLHLYIQGPENKDSHPSPLKLTQPVAQKEARPTPKPNPSNPIIAVTNTPPTTSTDHQSSDDEYVEEQIEDDNLIGSGGETDDEEYQASLTNRIKFNESQQLEHTELVSKILSEVTPPPNEAESQESEYEESDGDVLSPGESEDDNIRGNKHKNYTPVVTELTDWTKWKWVVGTRFENREGFKNALKNYAIYNGRNVKVTTSNKNRGSRLGATCVPPCPFKVYASYNEKIGSFMVKSVIGKHTCQRSMSKNRQFSCSYLANAFLPVFNANPNWPAKDIQDAVKEKFKMIISRWQAYNAKKVAHQKLHGSMLDHYSRLGSYIAALKEANPESTFVLSTVPSSYYGSDSGREVFFRFFVCFDGLRKGFLAGCRKLLCLDGCFLKTFLGGILLAAIGRDANDQMFPLAWAVVEGENNESWSWFMSELKVCLGVVDDGENWTLISDQQKGLQNAVALHWGRAEHRNCARHIYANWHKQHKGDELKGCFWRAVRAYNEAEFKDAILEMKDLSANATESFMKQNPKCFCRCFLDTKTKSDVVVNNMAETFNGFIIKSRAKHIIHMLEEIRVSLMTRLTKMQQIMVSQELQICPRIQAKLEKEKNKAYKSSVYPSTRSLFQVKDYDDVAVDMTKRSCTCKKWDLTGIPCHHACAVIGFIDRRAEEFVDDQYSKEMYMKSYEFSIPPLPSQKYWPNIDMPLEPPPVKQMPGRPKKIERRTHKRTQRIQGN